MEVTTLSHPDLPGVTIRPLTRGAPSRGTPQSVIVTLEPDAEIPLHTHEVDAYMHINGGCGIILSDDHRNGQLVWAGETVYFGAGKKHGFRASNMGLQFVSANGGIVDNSPANWDITFEEGPGFWASLWQWVRQLLGV